MMIDNTSKYNNKDGVSWLDGDRRNQADWMTISVIKLSHLQKVMSIHALVKHELLSTG